MKVYFDVVPMNASEVFVDTMYTFVTGNANVLSAMPYVYARLVTAAPSELLRVVSHEAQELSAYHTVLHTLQEVPTARFLYAADVLNECGFVVRVDTEVNY